MYAITEIHIDKPSTEANMDNFHQDDNYLLDLTPPHLFPLSPEIIPESPSKILIYKHI